MEFLDTSSEVSAAIVASSWLVQLLFSDDESRQTLQCIAEGTLRQVHSSGSVLIQAVNPSPLFLFDVSVEGCSTKSVLRLLLPHRRVTYPSQWLRGEPT